MKMVDELNPSNSRRASAACEVRRDVSDGILLMTVREMGVP
jgi:hypothetical protein